jgi:hypothetical protein
VTFKKGFVPTQSRTRAVTRVSPKKSSLSKRSVSPDISWRNEGQPITSIAPVNSSIPAPISTTDYAHAMKLLDSLSDEDDNPTYDEWYTMSADQYIPLESESPAIDDSDSDSDNERRMSYEKWSITDGEMFLSCGNYTVCQIFVFGIEYHYCYQNITKEVTWDLPAELRKDYSRWFLVLPKTKRKRFRLHSPPAPLKRVPKTAQVNFHPWVNNSYC